MFHETKTERAAFSIVTCSWRCKA